VVTGDQILVAVYKKLQADTTLQGATYLNGTTKIEKGTSRKKGFANPTITMKIGGSSNDIVSKLQDCTVYVNVFVDDKTNNTPNVKTLSLIAGRVESTLDDASLTNPTGARIINCYLTSPHGTIGWDREHPEEHFVTSVFRIQAIATS